MTVSPMATRAALCGKSVGLSRSQATVQRLVAARVAAARAAGLCISEQCLWACV